MSSANNRVKKSVEEGRSLINIRKSNGPSTLPWGTPQVISRKGEFLPSMLTNWRLLYR
mgnify:CR=1 FL=1